MQINNQRQRHQCKFNTLFNKLQCLLLAYLNSFGFIFLLTAVIASTIITACLKMFIIVNKHTVLLTESWLRGPPRTAREPQD